MREREALIDSGESCLLMVFLSDKCIQNSATRKPES